MELYKSDIVIPVCILHLQTHAHFHFECCTTALVLCERAVYVVVIASSRVLVLTRCSSAAWKHGRGQEQPPFADEFESVLRRVYDYLRRCVYIRCYTLA
jgi:hypothetical protein